MNYNQDFYDILETASKSTKTKINNDMYKLFEQIYNRKKVYYHASPNDFNLFESSPVFLSTNLKFIESFYDNKFNNQNGYLYECMLTKNLDLFNANCNSDFIRVIPFISNDEIKQFFLKAKTIFDKNPSLSDKRLMRVWGEIEKPEIQSCIKNAGFDGFSANNYIISEKSEFIAVYDPSSIKIVGKKEFQFSYHFE